MGTQTAKPATPAQRAAAAKKRRARYAAKKAEVAEMVAMPDLTSDPDAVATGHVATDPTSAVVKVRHGLPKITPDQETHSYWIGTTRECPIQNVTAGGITFPLFSGTPVFGIDGEPDRNLDMGTVIDLTGAQLDMIRSAVALRALRLIGPADKNGRRRGTMLLVDGGKRRYTPQASDVPLAAFLYMHRADRMTAADRATFPPETMLSEE